MTIKIILQKLNTARSMPAKLLAETLANIAKRKVRKHTSNQNISIKNIR